jgi:mono/diheme cytochrome c family protein
MKFRNRTVILLLIIIFNLGYQKLLSQDWEVPADKMQKVSPFEFTNQTQKDGESLFQRNCVSCHGTPGKANFVKLVPPPGDVVTDKFQKQTDGALFFKITNGRAPMPTFRDILNEQERWSIISYVRSFNPLYVQPAPVAVSKGSYGGMNISVDAAFLPAMHKIKLTVNGKKDKELKALKGIELALFAKRYFGNLPIEEPQTTDSNGEAFFDYADSIPGDTTGNVDFVLRINTEGFDEFYKDTVIKAGKVMKARSLIDTRAMWTVRSQAPIWLILSYSLLVIAVWGILGYIVMQIWKIKKAGEKKNS